MVVLETKINGATVRFHDDAYAGCSEEEIERRKQQARIVCERILARRYLESMRASEDAAPCGGSTSSTPSEHLPIEGKALTEEPDSDEVHDNQKQQEENK